MHRDAKEWRNGRSVYPSPLSKGGMEAEAPFHHRGRSRQNFGSAKDFCPNSPNLPEKSYVQFCLQTFTNKDHEDLFWCDLQKVVFMCFSANLGYHFLKSNNAGRLLYPDFQGFFSDFQKNQNIWGCAWITSTPTSNTTALHNSIIGNFMANQDWLETNLLQLFGHPENSKWYSKNFVIILEVGIVDEQKQTYLVAIYLFFTSFHCPQLFYCSPCLTAAPAALDMHVVSTNFAKTLVCKREYDVILWRHKQGISSNNHHHTSLLNTGRVASNQVVAPGITRPLHATDTYAGFFSCSMKLRGLLEYVYASLWRYVLVVKV